MESALLSYWSFEPMTAAQRKAKEEQKKAEKEEKESEASSKKKRPTRSTTAQNDTFAASHRSHDPTEAHMRLGAVARPQPRKEVGDDLIEARSLGGDQAEEVKEALREEKGEEEGEEEERRPPPKRVPVFFLDEAHKLPALIQSTDTMKTFLDAMLVITKQDRLCHVMHATSDPFYLHWLRQMNVMQHCVILSIGDTAKDEARRFFEDVLLPHIPDKLKGQVSFDALYKVYGGKLAHLSDYIAEFVNSDGAITPHYSTHFLQAHSLLNLQLIHAMPSSPDDDDSPSTGFRIYSSLANASPHAAPSPFGDESTGADFRPADLLRVMRRLQPEGGEDALPYFPLCRELGARAVDGMVRGRLLELRWSAAVTEEGETDGELGRKRKKVVGPVVLPTTPVVRYAMGRVLKEYEDEGFRIEDEDGKAQGEGKGE
ncbi:hypothetical protein JCM10449v2_007065 [Rhodotorula kratochvilovae]